MIQINRHYGTYPIKSENMLRNRTNLTWRIERCTRQITKQMSEHATMKIKVFIDPSEDILWRGDFIF